jgi:hypothetical protein
MMAQQNAVRQWHLRRSGAGSGTELRRLRNMPGLTGNEVADRMGWSISLMIHIESPAVSQGRD